MVPAHHLFSILRGSTSCLPAALAVIGPSTAVEVPWNLLISAFTPPATGQNLGSGEISFDKIEDFSLHAK